MYQANADILSCLLLACTQRVNTNWTEGNVNVPSHIELAAVKGDDFRIGHPSYVFIYIEA